MRHPLGGAALLVGALVGCSPHGGDAPSSESGPTVHDPLELGESTLSFTVTQRGTHNIPETKGRLTMTIGDVEGMRKVENVVVVDNHHDDEVVTESSMRIGDVEGFQVKPGRYDLHLVDTDSSHVVNDTATFEITLVRPKP